MNWSNIISKIKHAIIPAAGAAAAVAVGMVTGGVVAPLVILKAAGGAFIAYLLKPARPAPEAPPAK